MIPASRRPPATLPVPDAAAAVHSANLLERIAETIAASGGAIGFDRYMELALYAPGLGYYAAGATKLGPAGDFVTAPEVSPLFGRCVARQVAQVLDGLGGGDVLELGPGSGALAADVLLELERLERLPGRYLLLEPSPSLRERQRERLAQRAPRLAGRAHWLDSLPAPGLRGVILANEVADALPLRLYRLTRHGPRERRVALEGGRLAWAEAVPQAAQQREVADLLAALPQPLPEGYLLEHRPVLGPWIASLATSLAAGMLLLIDYGYPRRELYLPERGTGTLMCHYRHRAHDDPLIYPGLQDITAFVDFSAVAEAGEAAGLTLAGFTDQAGFLIASGLAELAAGQGAADPAGQLALAQQIKTLTLPSEMGERFKAIALTRGWERPPLGFAGADRRPGL